MNLDGRDALVSAIPLSGNTRFRRPGYMTAITLIYLNSALSPLHPLQLLVVHSNPSINEESTMSVINIQPNGFTVTLPPGAAPGVLHVYNTGKWRQGRESTQYNQKIGGTAVSHHQLAPGQVDTHAVRGEPYHIENYGDSILQLLFGAALDAEDADEILVSDISRYHCAPRMTGGIALVNDPNCMIDVLERGRIPNYFGTPSSRQERDARGAIARLEYADLGREPPFRITMGTVRLDAQGAAENARNWQIQINGVSGNSTISTMLIANTLLSASTRERQAFVIRSARNGLLQSLRTANVYSVDGMCV